MKEVEALEAKALVGQLLDWVEAGEEVVITRQGKAVAHMVPVGAESDSDRGRRAAARIRAMHKGVTLGGLAIKDLVNQGRPSSG